MPHAKPKPKAARTLACQVPTGIQGLDELTGGGLPKGRVSLVCGKAGSGKSLLAMEFLVHGAVRLRRAWRMHELRRNRGEADGQCRVPGL